MDYKKIFTHLIRAGRDAIHLEKSLKDFGYNGTPYFNIYGDIADAIYTMLGECTETFDNSLTYAIMHDIYTSDETCAENLASICKQQCILSSIHTTTREIISEVAMKRGMDPEKLAALILSEWATNQQLLRIYCE